MSKYFREMKIRTKLTGRGLLGEILNGVEVFLDGVAVKEPKKLKYDDLCAARKIVVDGRVMKDREAI